MSIVHANNLGKTYWRYHKPIDSLKELLFRKPYHQEFKALHNVSFHCNKGEVLGVVGDNGAGKSTLLKILAGTIQPSYGELTIKGRVSAILELGSGFHPDYTGLENIRLGCAMQGLDSKQVAAKIDEIIAFSELNDFIDEPVKTYSSGMFVRLAFSVVTSVDPDLLVVDEALAVGDQHFQKKSMDRMMAFKDQGKALIFCSHNLFQVKELCQRAIWLDKGLVQMQGDCNEVIDQYQDHIRMQNQTSITAPKIKETETQENSQLTAFLTEATLLDINTDCDGNTIYQTNDTLKLRVKAKKQSNIALDDIHIAVVIDRNDNIQCFGVSTLVDNIDLDVIGENEVGIIFEIPELKLLSGQYSLGVWLIDATGVHVYDTMTHCCTFKVRAPHTAVGVYYIEHDWHKLTS